MAHLRFVAAVLAALVLGVSLLLQAAETGRAHAHVESPDSARLQWKFADGEVFFYTHEEELSAKEFVAGQVHETTVRSLFKYKWTVLFEVEPGLKAIGVNFERVRKEVLSSEGTLTSDTYQPLSPRGLSTEAKTQQDAMHRVLQTHFVFFAVPNGGTMWPEALFVDRPVPNGLKTPAGNAFFAPITFTAGDALSLPDRSVKAGDEWTTPIVDFTQKVFGCGHYRVLGRASRLGHECWQIEGTTTYKLTPDRLEKGIASVTLGPRQSMHFFDADLGRLVLSEETTPIRTWFYDKRRTETVVYVKRQLAQPPSESDVYDVSRELADGETKMFSFISGMPANVQKEWLKVTATGLALHGASTSENTIDVTHINWYLVMDLSGQKLQSLRCYDVTQSQAIPLDYHRQAANESEGAPDLLLFETIPLSTSQPDWFHNDVLSERIIKVVAENEAGEIKTIYQPILISTAALRSSIRIAAPRPAEDRK